MKRTVHKYRRCGDVCDDAAGGASVFRMECDTGHKDVAADDARPRVFGVEGACSDESKVRLHLEAVELEVEVIHPDLPRIDHEPRLVDHQKTLERAEGEQIGRLGCAELERSYRVGLGTVALQTDMPSDPTHGPAAVAAQVAGSSGRGRRGVPSDASSGGSTIGQFIKPTELHARMGRCPGWI